MRVSFWTLCGLLITAMAAVKPSYGEQVLSNYAIRPKNDAVMREVARRFEVHERNGDRFEIYVPSEERNELLKLVPDAVLLQADIKDELRNRDLGAYHSFNEVEAILKKYTETYPDIAHLEMYGKSKKGNPLYALRVSGKNRGETPAPEIMLTAATHGNELITVEVLLSILDKTLTTYASDNRIRALVDGHQMYFIPVVNPDGFIARDRYDSGADPNRSYPWPQNISGHPTPSISPLIDFVDKHHFAGSIDFHSSGRLVMLPWAYTRDTISGAEGDTMRSLTKMMSSLNGYRAGQISRILYIAEGSSADYYFWKHNTTALAVEMATTNVPSASQIPKVVTENLEPTLRFIEHF